MDFTNIKKKLENSKLLKEGLPLGLAQTISKTILYPLERYKLIKQAQNTVFHNQSMRMSSFFDYLSRVPKEQGFLAFFRGNSANIYMLFPIFFVQTNFYENIKQFYMEDGEHSYSGFMKTFRKLGIALTSGFFTLCLSYPFDVIKTHMALDFRSNDKRIDGKRFRDYFSLRRETKSLYRGFIYSNIINLPYFASFYSFYELFKQRDPELRKISSCLGIVTFSNLLASLINYPLDSLKRRIQIMSYKEKSLIFLKNIYRNEGILILYEGFSINLTRFLIAIPLQFLILYQSKIFINEILHL